jgi:hypothetical protein
VAVLAAVTVGGAVADSSGNAAATNGSGEAAANASMGAEVSSFMQASTAKTEGEVDDEMFEAALSRTTDPEERRRLVENRTQRLAERHQRLEERRAEIRSNGTVRNRALAVRVAVGADQLTRSVNETEPVAASVGADTERLHELRTNARNLSGGEVAELARGLTGPPGGLPGIVGPPDDSPGMSPAGNETQVRPGMSGNATGDRPGSGGPGAGENRGNSSDATPRGGNGGSGDASRAETGPGGPNDGGSNDDDGETSADSDDGTKQ